MTNEVLLSQMADQPNEITEGLKNVFTSIVNQNLLYLKSVLHQVEVTSLLPTAKFWKAILASTYEILDKVNSHLASGKSRICCIVLVPIGHLCGGI